jgi:hypothetical protein
MIHETHAIKQFQVTGPHVLRLTFEDGKVMEVNLGEVLTGELFSPLNDPAFFRQVSLNPDFETVQWPNGADFDPETLYYWDRYEPAWREAAEEWKRNQGVMSPG